ncbi:hypothetical protein AB0B44_31890, partial [Streptomyces sp. NPDC041003]
MGGDEQGAVRPGVPRLRLDELLEELQVRIDEVRGTRDRLNGLLEAVMSVGRELDLPQVLRGIVEAAVVLVDAEYGAAGPPTAPSPWRWTPSSGPPSPGSG